MRKNKNYAVVILSILLMSLIGMLSGCQLAKKDVKAENAIQNQDVMVGALVVTNNEKLISSEQEGIKDENGLIKFNGVNGYYFGVNESTFNGEPVIGAINDKTLQNCNLAVFADDKSERYKVDADIYFNFDFNDVIRLYAVYQSPNKSYYCLPTTGALVDDVGSDGSLNLSSSSQTTTNNKKDKEKKNEFVLHFKKMAEVQTVTLKEMSSNDKLLKSTEYHKTDSDKIFIGKDTSYIIVEETSKDKLGDSTIKRTTYSFDHKLDKEEEISHILYYPNKDNILEAKKIIFQHE